MIFQLHPGGYYSNWCNQLWWAWWTVWCWGFWLGKRLCQIDEVSSFLSKLLVFCSCVFMNCPHWIWLMMLFIYLYTITCRHIYIYFCLHNCEQTLWAFYCLPVSLLLSYALLFSLLNYPNMMIVGIDIWCRTIH
jgi:hypothetical protein